MSDDTVNTASAAKAEELKAEANALFSGTCGNHTYVGTCWEWLTIDPLAAKQYAEAIEKYTAAIEANPKVAVYYSNRSACYIKTEAYGYAIA